MSLVTVKSSLSLKWHLLVQISMWLEYFSWYYWFESLLFYPDLLDKLTQNTFWLHYFIFFLLQMSAPCLMSVCFFCWSESNLTDTAENHTQPMRVRQYLAKYADFAFSCSSNWREEWGLCSNSFMWFSLRNESLWFFLEFRYFILFFVALFCRD